MRRLTKRDAERLLSGYDHDPVGALTAALRIVLDRPSDDFDALITQAALADDRSRLLLARRQEALDDLAAELNERRRI